MSTETLWIGGALFVVDYDDDGAPSVHARTVLGANQFDDDDDDDQPIANFGNSAE